MRHDRAMFSRAPRAVLYVVLMALAACRSDASGLGTGPEKEDVDAADPPEGETDAPDASTPVGTGTPDASAPDASTPVGTGTPDASAPDASTPVDPGPPPDPLAPDPDPLEGDDATDFISQLPRWLGNPQPPSSPWRVQSAQREAERLQQEQGQNALGSRTLTRIEGDRLYAFTAHLGLSIFDLSDPTRIRLLGRLAAGATPLEMHIEGGVALVVSESCGTYALYDGSTTMGWQIASCIQTLNVEDPANIRVIEKQVLPGTITAVHRIEKRLYVSTLEKDRCWGCEANPNVRIASFEMSEPGRLTPIDTLHLAGAGDAKFPAATEVTAPRAYIVNKRAAGGSTVNVVDLSDPTGKLALTAELPLKGEVSTPDMVSEHEGVLRIVYAPETWLQDYVFRLDTFRIVSSTEVVPLAELPFRFPDASTSLSVALFDRHRAFVAPWNPSVPLVVFDLTDPAQPKRAGALLPPDPVRTMKLRGDRLIALSHSHFAYGYKVSVSDVSDLTHPRMLAAVTVSEGSQLTDGPGDEQEVFEVFLDHQLIAVPVMSSLPGATPCTSSRKYGLQLFSLVGDDLTLQRFAHQQGRPATAAFHGARLIGVSDEGVEAFDITDRATPRLISALQVRPEQSGLAAFGDAMLRVSRNYLGDSRLLDVVPLGDPMTTEPLGRLELYPVTDPACRRAGGFNSGLWVQGNVAYIHQQSSPWNVSFPPVIDAVILHVVDLSDPKQPKLAGTLDVPVQPARGESGYNVFIKTDHALLLGQIEISSPLPAPPPRALVNYQIVDLTDPLAPKLAGRVQLPRDVAASGDQLLYHHVEPTDDDHGRYYLDRLDLSVPSKPVLRDRINIPGQPAGYHPESGRLVTVDSRLREQPSNDACSGVGFYGFDPVKRVCRFYDRYANVLVLEETRARRTSMLQLDNQNRITTNLLSGKERMYVITKPRVGELPVRANPFSFTAAHALRKLPSRELVPDGGGISTTILGDDLFVADSYQWSLTVTDPDLPPRVIAQGDGGSCSPMLHRDKLYCPSWDDIAVFDVVR